ncbi:hypothetical protein [Streptomyces sp. NPDC056452]|uniref:hypothetical protein n=1 Tax=Streptomyces sp. NPDC056452 TaxID=3345821 RepID=UPI0036B741DB
MSPHPGAPRGNAPPRGRPDAPARRARHALAALLLAVLTLVAGAPAAAGSVLPLGALAARSPVTANAPGAQPPSPHSDRTARQGSAHDTRRFRAAAAASPFSGSLTSGESGGPVKAGSAGAFVEAAAQGVRTEALPRPGPWAGADRPHSPHHFPPPDHGALPPCAAALTEPRDAPRAAAGTHVFVPGRVRTALPGVRGPPGVTAGQPAVHRSCSTDLSSRPL